MNGYSATKAYFNWARKHKEEASPSMGLLYLYLVEINNRLGWKKAFGITAKECQDAISVWSYNTYRAALDKLVRYGFIEIVRRSTNQYSPTIISLKEIDGILEDDPEDPAIAISKNDDTRDDEIQSGESALLKLGTAKLGTAKFGTAKNDEEKEDNGVALSSCLSKNDKPAETFKNYKTKTKNVENIIIEDPCLETEIYDDFKDFQDWILKNAPSVAKMKEPFTREQYERLFTDYPSDLIYEKLGAMHNYKPLLKNCTSANLTIRNWIRRDQRPPQSRSTRPIIPGNKPDPTPKAYDPYGMGSTGGKVNDTMAAVLAALRPDDQ